MRVHRCLFLLLFVSRFIFAVSSTAIALMALYPLFKKYGLKRVIMSTYQASSGAGAPGMNELKVWVVSFFLCVGECSQ
jgi:4-hydroxybenzoate polyprenyltransferase